LSIGPAFCFLFARMIPHFPKVTLILSSVCLLSLAQIAEANTDAKSAGGVLPPPPGSDMPLFELAAGYSYIRLNDGLVDNLNGFNVSAFYNLRSWLAIGAEFIDAYGQDRKRLGFSFANTNENRYAYMFGPRLSFQPAKRFRVFGQTLLGGGHAHATADFQRGTGRADAEAFVIMAGGGVDWKLTPLLTWRLVEADYMRFRLDGEWEGDLQLSTALVFTFGH
jgi:hypothetical protein